MVLRQTIGDQRTRKRVLLMMAGARRASLSSVVPGIVDGFSFRNGNLSSLCSDRVHILEQFPGFARPYC